MLENDVLSTVMFDYNLLRDERNDLSRTSRSMTVIVLLNHVASAWHAFVAAGAVVKENFEVPPRTLVAGVPAKVIREVSEAAVASIRESADGYVEKIGLYRA